MNTYPTPIMLTPDHGQHLRRVCRILRGTLARRNLDTLGREGTRCYARRLVRELRRLRALAV